MVTRKIRKNGRLTTFSFCFHNLIWIVAANNAFYGSIYGLRGLDSTIAIDEYKSLHTIKFCIECSRLILFLAHHLKCIIDNIKHRDRADTCFRFWLWNLQGGCPGISYRVVDNAMVYADLRLSKSRSSHVNPNTSPILPPVPSNTVNSGHQW